jgi:hypothetical protein
MLEQVRGAVLRNAQERFVIPGEELAVCLKILLSPVTPFDVSGGRVGQFRHEGLVTRL